ncbi:MAG: hypothetical protein IH921_10620, partial [Gemmatimonadetes bacterium]|nr:hypothetical protein [Gemmatimonadota bacterium]
LSLPRRQRKHRHISEARERAYADRLEEHASDYSYHLYQAGAAVDESKTIHFLRIAGIQALDGAAFEEALRQIDLALSIEEHPEERTHAELLRDRGTALRGLGRWKEAAQQWQETLPLFEALEDSEAVAQLCLVVARLLTWDVQLSEAIDLTGRGLAAVGTGENALRGELLAYRGALLQLSGKYDEGLELMNQARRVGEELGDARLVAITDNNRMSGDFNYGKMTQAIERGIPTIARLSDLELPWETVNCLCVTKVALLYAGRLDELLALGDDARDQALKLGHIGAWLLDDFARLNASWVRTGDLEALVSDGEHAIEAWSVAGPWGGFAELDVALGLMWRGDPEGALARVTHIDADVAASWWADTLRGGELLVRAYAEPTTAMSYFRKNEARLPAPGRSNLAGSRIMAAWAVESLAVIGERDKAAALYPVLTDMVDDGFALTWAGLTQTYAGIAAAAGRRWDDAERHFETALTQAHDMPFVLAQPETRRWYAWMLIDRNEPGDRDKAVGLLKEAIKMYGEIGMPTYVELAEELMAQT